jgi:parvulin-like peptidyl-prolyl isomerase
MVLFMAAGLVGMICGATGAAAQTPGDEDVVARVGDEVITFADLDAAWERMNPAQRPKGKTELESRQKFLEDYAISRLLAIEAMKRPKKLLPSQEEDYRILREQLLKNELYRIEVANRVDVSDVNFELFLKEISEILVVRVFVFAEQAGAQAWHSKLATGQPVSALEDAAETPSPEGPNLVNIGLMRRESMSDTLATALFFLTPGRCTPPIPYGQEHWGLYQVTKVIPRPSNVDINDPEQVVAEAVRYRIPAERERYRDELRESLQVEYHFEAIDTLVSRFAKLPPRLIQEAGEAPSVNLSLPLPELAEADSALVLATTVEGEVTGRDVFHYYARLQPTERREIRDRSEMITYVDRVAFDQELLRRAEALNLEESPEVKSRLTRRYEGYQVAFLYEDSVLTQVAVPEDSLRAYYEAYPGAFDSPASARVWMTLTQPKERADSLLAAARGGADLRNIAMRFSLHSASMVNGGETGWLNQGESPNPEFEDLVFATAVGEFAGPVQTQDGWVLFKVLERRPAVTRDFEGARPYIRATYEGIEEERVMQRYLTRLRQRIPTEIHTDRLATRYPQG